MSRIKSEVLVRFLKENALGYLSGEEIAQRMNVSRTAIWNHIQELRGLGYDVQAVPHRGYRLVGLPDRLLPDEITGGLNTRIFGKRVQVYEKLASTNDAASQAAQGGALEGTAIFAEAQTKGRGRLGRRWHSPSGKGLWFSVVLRPPIPMAHSPRITLVAAVGVAKALREVTGLKIQIKWPNDLYLAGKKLGGILTEIDTDLETIRYAVLGIGINVNLGKNDFSAELRDTATSLKIALARDLDRNQVARSLLEHLEKCYDDLIEGNFEKIKEQWDEMSLATGRYVQIVTQQRGQQLEGIVQGVDENGCLIVRRDNGILQHVISGDVLLKE